MKRFLNLIVYIFTIHVSALLIAGLFRLVLFISSYHQLTFVAADNCGGVWSLQLLWESIVPFLHNLFQCVLWTGLFNQCVGHTLLCLFL